MHLRQPESTILNPEFLPKRYYRSSPQGEKAASAPSDTSVVGSNTCSVSSPHISAVSSTQVNTTTLKFGTLNASLPPRVQSAPPTLEEEQRQRQLQQAEASIAVPSGATGLEPTPEGQETSFDARQVVSQADAQVPASTQDQQYPVAAHFQQQGQSQPQYGYYQGNQYHQPGYYQQAPSYHNPQQSHNSAYYHPHGQTHQQTHHYQNPYQHHQPTNGSHHQPHYQGHHQYPPRRGGYYAGNAGGYPPAVGYYGAPIAASQIYQQQPYQQYPPSQPYYRPTSGPSKPVVATDPLSTTNVPGAPNLAGPTAPTAVSNISSSSMSPVPLVRQSKKIQIVDPNTMKEVELTDIPKVKVLSSGTSSVTPTSATVAKASPAVPAKLEVTQPVRKPVVLVDPTSNKEVDLSTLAASTQKLANILDEMDEDGLFDSSDSSDSEEEGSLSQSDMSERESDGEADEEESEEEDYSSLDFPVILTRNIKVNYPDGAVSFIFPKEDEPLRYSTEFLLQFAPHCQGEAKDIASVAFPKEVPIRERSERRSHRTTSGTGRSSHQERHHRSGGGKHRHHHHTYNPEDTVLTNRAADAWKRASAMVMDEDLVMLREIKMLLNKLTEEKFETLTQQILQIGVLKTGMTTGVIDMLFDKAVEEPRYAPLYARLCHRIWLFEIEALKRELPVDQHADIGKKSVFRKSLVTKCQVEYDTKRAYSKQRLEKLMAKQLNNGHESPISVEGAAIASASQESAGLAAKETPKYTGELTEEDYAMIKLKRRVLGNMRFIGELFIVGLIPGKIMHSVIQELLADVVNPEEEEVESVCRLLPTVGAALDKPDMSHIWGKYVERLRTLSGNTKLPSRVRFMVLDVLELRDNGWSKVAPVASSSVSSATGRPPRNEVASGRRDPSGPAPRPGRDSIRYSTAKSQDVRYERSTPSPRLANSEEFQASARVQNRHAAQGAAPRAMATIPSNATEAEEISRPASRASQESLNRYQALEEEESTASPGLEQDSKVDEKLLGKLTSTFDESMTQKNYEDVTLILAELPASARILALQHLLLHVMDKGKKSVEMLTNTLLPEYIFQKDSLTHVELLSALRSTLEQLDDLVVDIPNAPEYAGALAASFIRAKLLTLRSLVGELLHDVLARSPSTVAKVILFTLRALPNLTEAEGREMIKNVTDSQPVLRDPLNGLKSLTERLGLKNLLDSDA